MAIRVMKWAGGAMPVTLRRFLARPAFDGEAETVAAEVLAAVRRDGMRAVTACARRFDGVTLRPGRVRVTAAEMASACRGVDRKTRGALREAHARVAAFARRGRRADWGMRTPHGGEVGERFVALERVGVYVPGGTAPLVSSALMTATLARVAGVEEIVACTPCRADGTVDPVMLYALKLAGATEIYRVGGIQAIGLMAFGAGRVRKVEKIVGPGNRFVTAAKRQVYGEVALDLVAGPSEIAVLADETAEARCVAADLLSQAEHGTGWEKALLVTTRERLAREVARELGAQAARLSRREAVMTVLRKGTLLVVVPRLEDGMRLCNTFAPEHLELLVRAPRRWLKRVRHAGAVFVGRWTPECVGDFVAGPSHVLPTGGAAVRFSGLTVDDFRKRSSYMAFSRADLKAVLPVLETFGEVEGLDAHARSARVRFEPS
jgi:histidinol dehydrogenase